MARIVGLGGVFYKADDPQGRKAWYEKHLGLHPGDGYAGVEMRWRRPDDPDHQEMSLVSFFDQDTTYLGDAGHPFMLNFVCEGIEGYREKLIADGIEVSDIVDEGYGKFAWFTDPGGVKIEIWEPAQAMPDLPAKG
ncbi:VOC family protein [Parvularcula sp. ZS-1/3]|uniref:VOC family protein n=1 Tax=Parvularcula mediterranea TaxID=2732508 RepID=A0A7Y3W4N8_9PROT|nr:VOC family protein [Parvularcula mediterranea]NNU15653.1 VOC family protein [Parvularcula mediterranea]